MFELAIPIKWTEKTYKSFAKDLTKLEDTKYKAFNSKLIFTKYQMIGITIPTLRNIAKKIKNTNIEDFLCVSIPTTYEEIFIRGIVISYITDYDKFIVHFKDFLKYIDNWAICDMVISSYKIIKKNQISFEKEIYNLLQSSNEYEVRVGVVSLMDYYIKEENLKKIFNCLNNISHDAYYVHMAIAWIVSIMYIKYPKETERFLKNNNLRDITHNKAIQKIRESKRVSQQEKDYILKYKR